MSSDGKYADKVAVSGCSFGKEICSPQLNSQNGNYDVTMSQLSCPQQLYTLGPQMEILWLELMKNLNLIHWSGFSVWCPKPKLLTIAPSIWATNAWFCFQGPSRNWISEQVKFPYTSIAYTPSDIHSLCPWFWEYLLANYFFSWIENPQVGFEADGSRVDKQGSDRKLHQ